MSWKFLITCFVLLVIGFTGLQILDQRIVSVNKKITGYEKQIYIDHFQTNFISYLDNLKVNLEIIKIMEPDQISRKWLTEFATSYSSVYPAFDSLYVIEDSKIVYPFSNNYKHLIHNLSYEQIIQIDEDVITALKDNKVILSKPLDFFNEDINYVLFFVPIRSEKKNKVLVVLFNLKKIIDDNISSFIQLSDITLNITTPSNKLIYGNKIDDSAGNRVIIEGFKTPIGTWNFEIIFKTTQQYQYLRQLIWVLGFALMAFLVFYMLIVERKNSALTKNLLNLKTTEQKLKIQYEREQLLRKIIQNIHLSKNIDDLINLICNELANYLKVDYSGFLDVDDKAQIKFEYFKGDMKNSLIGESILPDTKVFNQLVNNKTIFYSENLLKDQTDEARELYEGNFKQVRFLSLFPVVLNEDLLGLIMFANVSPSVKLDEEEIEFMKSAMTQIAVALNQANLTDELHSRSRTIMENITQEQCLKNIIRVIRTSVDVKEITYFVNKELSNFLNVEKVFVVEMDEEIDTQFVIRGDYNAQKKIASLENNEKFIDQLSLMMKYVPKRFMMKQLVYSESENFFKRELNKTFMEVFSGEFVSKSFVATPIIFQHKLFGTLVLAQVSENKQWQPSELEFLTKVAEQLAISMYQVKLYDELRKFTDKQLIINKIFEVIRSSIDIDEILWNACHEIGMYLKVDRCGIIEYNSEKKITEPLRHEFLASRTFEHAYGASIKADPDDSYAMHCLINENRPFVLDDVTEVQETDSSNEIINYLNYYKVKSFLMVPIVYVDDVMAFLILGQCKDKRRWNDSEIYFLKSISSQIAIAMYQAKLFRELNIANQKLLTSYKKEQTVRRILEVVRSSFDLEKVYTDITEEIGKMLKVNRCYIVEYDSENDAVLPPSVEYRSDDSVLSIIGEKYNPDELKFITNFVKKAKKPFIIDDVEKFVVPGLDFQIAKKLVTKSIIFLPIASQEKPLGILVATQTEFNRVWTLDEIEILSILSDHLAIAISQIKMYEYVRETSRLKSEFLASVSHELKTPLNSIIVLSELMQNKDSTKSFEEQVELLQIIHSSGEDLLKHINNILDMVKVEFTKNETNFHEFDLHDLIDEIRLLIKPLVDEKSLNLFVNIEDNVSDKIYSDRKLLKFIINNLMNNAIKFTHNGYIELSLSRVGKEFIDTLDLNIDAGNRDEYLLISVKDTGIGIEEQYHKLIFDEFRQIEDAEVRKYSGTGLGLSICKKSVEILNGKIWVESELGKGSNFKVLIPF